MRHRGIEHGGEVFLLKNLIVHDRLRDVHELDHFAIFVLEYHVIVVHNEKFWISLEDSLHLWLLNYFLVVQLISLISRLARVLLSFFQQILDAKIRFITVGLESILRDILCFIEAIARRVIVGLLSDVHLELYEFLGFRVFYEIDFLIIDDTSVFNVIEKPLLVFWKMH